MALSPHTPDPAICPSAPPPHPDGLTRETETSWSLNFWFVVSQILILVMIFLMLVMLRDNSQDLKQLRRDFQLLKLNGQNGSAEDISSPSVIEVTPQHGVPRHSVPQSEVETDFKL